MSRKRSPKRDEAYKLWRDSGGTLTPKEVAEKTGLKAEQVRKWKSLDKWQLDKNQNAKGHGAPTGNKNAVTHGAYVSVHLGDLSPEERASIEDITLDVQANLLRELKLLLAKESDLRRKIRALEEDAEQMLHTDKVVEMSVPSKKGGAFKPAMQSVVKASTFEWVMKLEAELNKTHGRIIKLLDSIKTYELEHRRVRLEERKHTLAKQRLSGAFEINPDTGEIDDETDDEIGLDDEPVLI